MKPFKIQDMIEKINVSIDDPSFYEKVFSLISRQQKHSVLKQKNFFLSACKEEYDDLSRRVYRSKIQDPGSVRNVLKTRSLANLLIDDKGEILVEKLPELTKCLTTHLYSLGPERQDDSPAQELLLRMVTALQKNKQLLTLLRNVSKPYANIVAEGVIRDTLLLPPNISITDAHARRAALSALFCYLRQSVGSCFGTAPSIIIHDEQPVQFLKDIVELLGTGRLKRTYGGVEYAVPLSTTWGKGDFGRIIPMPKGLQAESLDLALSPGIIAALIAVGLIPEDISLKEKIEKSRSILFQTISFPEFPYTASIEFLLQAIVLKQLDLTEQDIYDYRQKVLEPVMGLLLVTAQTGIKDKSRRCEQFESLFKRAQSAFLGIADNALLKSWEFTVASFAENKAGFTTWNLYESLGFNHEEYGGIGQKLYEIILRKLDESNQKVSDFQFEYEQAYNHLKYLETRMRTTSTEKELEWLRVEYQSRRNEFNFLEEMRDRLNAKAHRFANLFNLLVDIYLQLFPQYFQEVYDADMHEVETGPYDDSPAGFRLLYKHGRGNTSQWSRIYNEVQYINSLVSFFTATEVEIRHSAEMEGLEEDFSEIVTSVVSHIRSEDFLKTAFKRMHKARQTKTNARPWAYISGGSMHTLVSSYYRRQQKPTEVARWVESPMELLVFFVDTLKHIPSKILDFYINEPNKSMLTFSPTHAYLLKPGFLKKGWQNQSFTYTWIRDEWVTPRERFVDLILLYPEDMQALIDKIAEGIPQDLRRHFKNVFSRFYGTMKVPEFREHLLIEMSRDNRLHGALVADDIDRVLFSELPLFSREFLKERIANVFKHLPEGEKFLGEAFNQLLEKISEKAPEKISSKILQNLCKIMILLISGETSFPKDYHRLIAIAAQKLGYAMPEPIFFADTNWTQNLFAFVVNPGTAKLELWRVNFNGTSGSPMSAWSSWLDGSNRSGQWGIYTKPHEYEAFLF